MSLRQLPPPITDTQSITFRSDIGIEKREVSTHCASFYTLLAPLLNSLSSLISPSLIPYMLDGLEKGLKALTAIEGQVYKKWLSKSDHKVLAMIPSH